MAPSESAKTWALRDVFETLRDFNLEGQIIDQETTPFSQGSTWDVFRASLARPNDKPIPVAVKQIRRCLLIDDSESFARNLGREVRLWSKLKHSNVLPVLGFVLEGQQAFPSLVSEWMKHGTVVNYMKERPPDGFEICRMAFGIASGLLYVHTEHDMIHADLKGSNILVSDDGRPLLADFGLSVSSSSMSLAATTYHGQMGTKRWMAKELHSTSTNISELPKHTTMTDMWAFGMVIYELLTRKIPFHDIAPRKVFAAILSGQLPDEPDFPNCSHSLIFCALWAIALLRCIPEYVVHWDTFVQMATEYNLELQYKSEFHDLYAEHCDHEEYGPLLQSMSVVDAKGKRQMNEDQWETANMYIAFVFKKL